MVRAALAAALTAGLAGIMLAAPAYAVTPEDCLFGSVDAECQQQASGVLGNKYRGVVCGAFAEMPAITVSQAFQRALDGISAADPALPVAVRGTAVRGSLGLCSQYADAVSEGLRRPQ